ncbi:conserved hypothetical protein [Paraburkholderia unamae]|nr:conserved hypothetical protein [Paraburkholderia unamae]
MLCVGFDPGGKRAFGWCAIEFEGEIATRTMGGVVSCATEAIERVKDVISTEPPAAVGIDAPLFWTDGNDREADKAVRKFLCSKGGHGGTVGHVNSLRGACLVQGILVARKVAFEWPGAAITEAHPKALTQVWPDALHFGKRIQLTRPDDDHMYDAAIAAFSAHALATRAAGWRDLAPLDMDAYFPSGKHVHYWFPEENRSDERKAIK